MDKPAFQPFHPSADDLRQTLAYEIQQLNPIALRLRKMWADWPRPPIPKDAFYQKLLETILDSARYPILRNELIALAQEKGKDWPVKIPIFSRIIYQALNLYKIIDPDGWAEVKRDPEISTNRFSQISDWLDGHSEHPQCVLYLRVLNWIKGIEEGLIYGAEKSQSEEPPGTGTTNGLDANMVRGVEWDKAKNRLIDALNDQEINRFSRSFIQVLQNEVETLKRLADVHETQDKARQSAIVERFGLLLKDVEAILPSAGPDLASVLANLRTRIPTVEQDLQWDLLDGKSDAAQACLTELRAMLERNTELDALLTQAHVQKDYDAIIAQAQSNKDQEKRVAQAIEQLMDLIRDLAGILASSYGPEDLAQAKPLLREDCVPSIESKLSVENSLKIVSSTDALERIGQVPHQLRDDLDLPIKPDSPTTVGSLFEVSEYGAADSPFLVSDEHEERGNVLGADPTDIDDVEFAVEVQASGNIGATFLPGITAAVLVDGFLKDPTVAIDAAMSLVWALVRDDQLALAYQLALALERNSIDAFEPLDANAFLALFLARQIHGPTDEVAEPLRDALTSLLVIDFGSRPVRHRRANRLIAYAAALRPALLAPSLTGARAVLEERHLPLDFASLDDLRTAIIDSSRLGTTLSEASLKGRAGPGTWEHHLQELRQTCLAWWVDHRHRRLRYAATAKVWQRWLEDTGPIGVLLQAVAEDRRDFLDQARREVEEWSDSRSVNRQLDLTDQEIRGRNAKLRPIDGSPRRDAAGLAAEAMDFVRQWLALHASRPSDDPNADSPDLVDWVQRTQSLLQKAKEDLALALAAPTNLPDLAALRAVSFALDDLADLLDPRAPMRRGLPWWKQLASPLLQNPDIPLDDHWCPTLEPVQMLSQIVSLAAGANSFQAAFTQAQAGCAHGATGRIIEVLGASGNPPEDLEVLAQRRNDSLEQCRKRLTEGVRKIAGAVSHAVDSGYLDEEERARIGEQLESCKDRQDGDIGSSLHVLSGIEEELRKSKQRRISEERERLIHNESLAAKPELRARIEKLLEGGELATAAEYVTHAENGEDPPSDDQAASLGSEFFPVFLAQATEQLAGNKGGEILRILEVGRSIGPLVPATVDAENHLTLLRAWLQLQGRRSPLNDAVSNLLLALGFRSPRVELDDSEPGMQGLYTLHIDPLQDRSVCIVPQFGSLARGHYRVVCIWDRTPADEMRKYLGRRGGSPTLVLYLNRMLEGQRRELAYQCRQNRQTFLVLDEWLLYFLMSREPAARLAAFFQCSFQFTVVNPYTPTSSDVPDEIFFGRRRAMDQIADLHGSNLVFGGRQLGKTALLREVKRRFHAPQNGFHVCWIDLKYEGIGVGRPLEEVWAVIGGELTKGGVLSSRISRPDSIQNEIAAWLMNDDRRRLLFLLDEADELFAQDAKVEYKTLMGLKNLMERTNRRFKVVFAGLHNVQRMSRDVNSPVKHLSKPICVGPLLEDGESREAFRLVSMPLRMLGYRCAEDVVNTILSYTNYYPNLIQHFCHSLLENLNQERFDTLTTPPYEISAVHVEQAYQRRELRQFIRDRFQITLDLDPRYRVLALRIALETLERRKSGEETASGFGVEWIRGEALRLWQVGFKDRASEAFRTLLDEMVGLGLLRHAQRGYALRSPNIVNLLGVHDAIQQDLLDACEKDPPPVYTAATYRRALGDDQWQRSPLVAEQEYELFAPETGVVLLFGTALAGIDRVTPAITSASARVPEAQLLFFTDLADVHELERRLRATIDKQKLENLVVLIDHQTPWNERWIHCIDQSMRARRRKRFTTRVVLLGDAAMAWYWSGLCENQREKLEQPRIMTLKPWAPESLRQWQRDNSIGPLADADEAGIVSATGLWDGPMFLLGGRVRSDPGNWRKVFKDAEQQYGEHRLALNDALSVAPGSNLLFAVLAEFDEALSAEDIVELTDLVDLPEVKRLLNWADLLGFVRPEGQGWRIDPFITRLLRKSEA